MTKWLLGSIAAAALVVSPLAFAGGEGCSKTKAQCEKAKAQAVAAVAVADAGAEHCAKQECWIKFPAKASEGITLASATSRLEELGSIAKVGSCDKSHALYVRVNPGQTLKMSEVLAALDGSGVAILRDQIQLPKSSSVRATISGMSCGACANKVQGTIASLPTIEKAKVEVGFADFTVKDDMSYASLAKGVENGRFKIEDLSWTAPKPVVAEVAAKASKGECPYASAEACKEAKAAGKSGECCGKTKAQPKP